MRLEEHAQVAEHGALTHSIHPGLRDPLFPTQGDAVASAPYRAAVDGAPCVIDRPTTMLLVGAVARCTVLGLPECGAKVTNSMTGISGSISSAYVSANFNANNPYALTLVRGKF
ncbi:hypothetical protein BH11GEM1_BH11GEM1_08530 [soil metagenome]